MGTKRDGNGPVAAAGGLVVRGPEGGREVLLVHRPDHDDWSFPKGKREPGETDEECALREVAEETGYHCALGPFLGTSEYLDAQQRPKTVRYWAMRPLSGAFAASDEVDAIAWCAEAEAASRLTYPRDADLLARLVDVLDEEASPGRARAAGS